MIKKFRKNLLIIASIVMVTSASFTACSNDDKTMDLDLLSERAISCTLNEESLEFKHSLISVVKEAQARAASDEEPKISKEEMAYLKTKSLNMFKSHGFTEEEVTSSLENDEQLILSAMFFVAWIETSHVSD